jgi:UDP-3-O-[3-hydroxymyristoyl] glucosamine N-acyltransferase
MARALRLAEIAERLGGELVGNPDVLVWQVATLENGGPNQISFLSKARYRRLLTTTRAAALILSVADRGLTGIPHILCDDPYLYFANVSRLFNPEPAVAPGVHQTAIVHPDAVVSVLSQLDAGCIIGAGARIDEGAIIGAGSIVGDRTRIGSDTRLYARVTVYHDCDIGQRNIIHSGVVIGSDGFGLARSGGTWLKIPQIGRVRIGNDVEIGANTTIDRGAIDDTVIEDGVKLDNQIQIGHNVRIGEHTAMAGCVGVAGSANIGRGCTVGGGAIILGHLTIADHVNISAGTLVAKSITAPGTYTGAFPTDDHKSWLKNASHLRNLDSIAGRLSALEKKEKKE